MMALAGGRMADQRISRVRKELLVFGTFSLLLLVLLGPWLAIGLDSDPTAGTGQGSALRQGLYLVLAGVMLFAMKPLENYKRLLAIPGFLLLGLAWCWLSLTWAIEPAIAVRRLFLTTLIMWMLFASMRQLKFEEVVLMLRIVLVIILLCNYAAVFLLPEYGVHTGNEFDEFSLIGDWRGILQHKNLAGAACAITMIFFTFDRGKMPRWVQIGVLLAAAIFLYMSNSKTSFGLGVAALSLGALFLRYDRKYRNVLMILVCLGAVAAILLEAIYQNPLAGQFSDPKAFTGRVEIWNALMRFALDHPLLGAGYGSFWNIGPESPIYAYASGEITEVPNGHNGYLDILVQLGFPGLLLIVAVAVVVPVRRLLSSPITSGQKGALLMALFLFCIGHNATESSLFDRDMLVWVMLMIAMALSQPNLILYSRARFDVHDFFRVSRSHASAAGGGRTDGAAGRQRRGQRHGSR